MPWFSIRLDTVLTKFMGETAAKLRLILDALAQTRGVYVFDEVDAAGGDRAALNDVGENRRVLNSFLQFLIEDASESVILKGLRAETPHYVHDVLAGPAPPDWLSETGIAGIAVV
ncbi:AAA family ATPase [Paenarthrobacter nitroguajacolicus]